MWIDIYKSSLNVISIHIHYRTAVAVRERDCILMYSDMCMQGVQLAIIVLVIFTPMECNHQHDYFYPLSSEKRIQ